MSSRFHEDAACAALLVAIVAGAPRAARRAMMCSPRRRRRALRVCADPDNLPFSNERGEGFENRLADCSRGDLGTRVEYTWWAQRRGFLRKTLKARPLRRGDGRADAASSRRATHAARTIARATSSSSAQRSRPRRSRRSTTPRLRALRIGVQLVGDDGANAPPAHALRRRGLVANLVRVSVYGDAPTPDPGARIVDAVARGDVDIAAAWGPRRRLLRRRGSRCRCASRRSRRRPTRRSPRRSTSRWRRARGDKALPRGARSASSIAGAPRSIACWHRTACRASTRRRREARDDRPPLHRLILVAVRRGAARRLRARSAFLSRAATLGQRCRQRAAAAVAQPVRTSNAWGVGEGKRLYKLVQLRRLPRPRRRRHGPGADGRRWIYGSDDASIFETIAQGRPNGMPAFGGEHHRTTGLAAGRLRRVDERPAADGRRCRAAPITCATARPRTRGRRAPAARRSRRSRRSDGPPPSRCAPAARRWQPRLSAAIAPRCGRTASRLRSAPAGRPATSPPRPAAVRRLRASSTLLVMARAGVALRRRRTEARRLGRDRPAPHARDRRGDHRLDDDHRRPHRRQRGHRARR